MAYNLLVISPCTVSIGKGYPKKLMAGDVVKVDDFQGERIINGAQRNNFKVLSINKKEEKVEEKKEEKKDNINILEQLEKVEEPTKEEGEEAKHLIPLEDNAPWQLVRNYVLELEEQIPINLKLIKAVQIKYSNYQTVVKECKRILEKNTKKE